MKKFLFAFVLLFAVFSALAPNPSYTRFSQSDFTTNGGVIRIRPEVLTPPTAALPNLGFDLFMDEHFGVGKNASANIGKYGWTQATSGGGGLELGTEENHWGTLRLRTTSLIGSDQEAFCGRALFNRPTIPPLNATTGWTNRVIWRMVGTNSCRFYMALSGATSLSLGAGSRQQLITIFADTTNSAQILGMVTTTATGGTTTSTNLGVLQDNTWYTNEFWSHISGVICFNLNGGAGGCVSNNIATAALIPHTGVVKTVNSTATNIIEIDEWFLVKVRQ